MGMDPILSEALWRNDVEAITKLVNENERALDARTKESKNTPLHVACKYGHEAMVRELLRWRPEMVAAKNAYGETAMHIACCHGKPDVVRMLMESNQWVACELDSKGRSPLLMACIHGQLKIVEHLLEHRWILLGREEEDGCFSSLHAAVSLGRAGIVKEMLRAQPSLALNVDKNGETLLHYACEAKDVEIARMLVCADAQLATRSNEMGYTPLHVAAVNASIDILKEFFLRTPLAFHSCTRDGETVFHLFAKFNKVEPLKYFMEALGESTQPALINLPNQFGNTALHVAVLLKHYEVAEYLIENTTVELNARNSNGDTAIDILTKYKGEGLIDERMIYLLAEMVRIHGDKYVSGGLQGNPYLSSHLAEDLTVSNDMEERRAPSHAELQDYDADTDEAAIQNENQSKHRKKRSMKQRDDSIKIYKPQKQKNTYKEALQNARNTIVVVAVLVASMAFSAGVNPPGGVYQDGPFMGKSVLSKTTAFKVFFMSNIVALFVSLGIVTVLVSIIPFRRKPLKKIISYSHKALWVASSFMATAFLAATWAVMLSSSDQKKHNWIIVALLTISIGTLGAVFLGLIVLSARHYLRKLRWRRAKLSTEGRQEPAAKLSTEGPQEPVAKLSTEERQKPVAPSNKPVAKLSTEGRQNDAHYFSDSDIDSETTSDYASSRGEGFFPV